MGIFSWFSANEDGEVVAKTDVQSNGAVNRYEYKKKILSSRYYTSSRLLLKNRKGNKYAL